MEYLKDLTNKLDLSGDTIFTGLYSDVQRFQNILDISVSLSTEQSESFSVATLEPVPEKPVVVSNVGGLPEIKIMLLVLLLKRKILMKRQKPRETDVR